MTGKKARDLAYILCRAATHDHFMSNFLLNMAKQQLAPRSFELVRTLYEKEISAEEEYLRTQMDERRKNEDEFLKQHN